MTAFQVVTPKQLGQVASNGAVQTLYGPVPANTRTMVKCIDFCNTTAVAIVGVTVYLVHSGGAAGTGNMLIPGITLSAAQPFQWSGTQVLNAGDSLQVSAPAGITFNASGGEAV